MKLSLRNLSFSYGEARILRGISFDVTEGGFLGLMGPNGSGKTTLLRCIMRFLETEADMVSLDDRSLQSLSPAEVARTFAVVPQSSSTDFIFTAYDIVMMGRIPHFKSRLSNETKSDADVVKDAMRRTNTWRFSGRQFSELSGGERQRVLIARALAQQPRCLLLDEPTVYLDINGQFEVMDLIRRLNRESGITVIAVLHDVNLAARYCDTIALLSHGRLEAIGPPAEVLAPETIQSVYGIDVIVRKDPFSQAVYVLPHTSVLGAPKHGRRVHVLCGGGSGGPVMKALVDNGYSVSAGALNVLDSDFQNAQDLHIAVAAESPFSPISDEVHRENLRLIGQSEAVVVTTFPVGPGNLRNLEAARAALDSNKRVFVLGRNGSPTVDFVGGKADAIVDELISRGAVTVSNTVEIMQSLSVGERP